MSKQWTPRKTIVELDAAAPRPSRIRREPPPPPPTPKALRLQPGENEAWVVTIGVMLFALAIFIITVGVSEYTK